MTSTCPHCGKPVRPGARFCGSCGQTLPPAPPPIAPSETVCPHCGNPIRPDAKFCPSCGEAIPAPPIPAEPAAKPPIAAEPIPGEVKPPRSFVARFWWLFLLLFLALALILFGGYWLDPFGWRATETPTPEEVAPATETPTPTLTQTLTSPTVVTATVETNTPTFTIEPSATGTTTSTPEPSATPASTPQAPTGTSQPPLAVLPFEEDFQSGLEDNWLTWGEPIPSTTTGGRKYLDLNSSKLSGAGISSTALFSTDKRVMIQFAALLKGDSPLDILNFDWDPGGDTRKPEDAPGAIHIAVGNGEVVFYITLSESCTHPLMDTALHTYEIQIDSQRSVRFLMDGDEICPEQLPSQLPSSLASNGRISFSGRGYVENVKVFIP